MKTLFLIIFNVIGIYNYCLCQTTEIKYSKQNLTTLLEGTWYCSHLSTDLSKWQENGDNTKFIFSADGKLKSSVSYDGEKITTWVFDEKTQILALGDNHLFDSKFKIQKLEKSTFIIYSVDGKLYYKFIKNEKQSGG